MKATLPKRFLTRRDKNGHQRSRSSENTQKHRPLSSDAFFAIFKPDGAKQQVKDDERKKNQELEDAKIQEVQQRLSALDINTLSDDIIRFALQLKSSYMDVDKALDLILLQRRTITGVIIPYNPALHMLGAENKGNVTCYLDALLFAMFAKLDSYEGILKIDGSDEQRNKLAAILRLWVNLLRSGKLIETEITQVLQNELAACGWREAQLPEQQDTSEAFAFITETLRMPLLALQMDLFHQGENDEADHRLVYERLLNLAIPADPDGKGVKLEECLEEYFNSKVDVLRDSLDEKKAPDQADPVIRPTVVDSPEPPKAAIRIIDEEGEEQEQLGSPEPVDPDEENRCCGDSRPAAPESRTSEATLVADAQTPSSSSEPAPRPFRTRTESIIQRVVIGERNAPTGADIDESNASLLQRGKGAPPVVRAVTIPAWQFFRLIPWHSPMHGQPKTDQEVAWHFDQRPVVGICLKRYMMDKNGSPKRQNTYIDIPETLRLPKFIIDDRQVDEGGLADDYKLVLQSVVCHRGESLQAGHYIAFARVAPKLLTENRRYESDPPPDYEEAQWVKFDDLASERVSSVDDFQQAFKQEMPYLLFYQIIPKVDGAPTASGDGEGQPPAYYDAPPPAPSCDDMTSSKASSYFENAVITSAAPSIRFSAEVERPSRRSFADEDGGYLSASRRDSAAYSDYVAVGSPLPSTDGVSPGEETTAQRLSRAAAKLRGASKSRPQSQSGEHRLSSTMSRFGFKTTREPLRDSPFDDNDEGTGPNDDDMTIEHDEKDGTSRPNGKRREKDKENHKRNKSKSSPEKEPDRECVVQ